MDPNKLFDRYVFQARLMPTLTVAFPVAVLAAVVVPVDELGLKALSGLVTMVLMTLLAQIGRDAGREKEPGLFRAWGGKPSTRKLRHRDSDLNQLTLAKLHERLAGATGAPAPTPKEEAADPEAADVVYEAYGDHLREATRGDSVLLSENISYGFRRNLWGMKTGGLALAVIGTIGCAISAFWSLGEPAMAVPALASLVNATLLAFWVCRVTRKWVRRAAEAYADRLVRTFLAKVEKPPAAAA